MRRELGRTQALLRLVRKSVKLCEPGEEKGKAGKRRRKQKPARTGRLVARLRTPPEAEGRADA